MNSDYPIKIKQLRLRLGLTQVVFAKRVGVSFATVNRWENGKTKPTQLCWARIVEIADNNPKMLDPYPFMLDISDVFSVITALRITTIEKDRKLSDKIQRTLDREVLKRGKKVNSETFRKLTSFQPMLY